MYSAEAVDNLITKLSEAIAEINSLKEKNQYLAESLECIHAAILARSPEDLEDLIPGHLAHFSKSKNACAIDTYELVVDKVNSEHHWYHETLRLRGVIRDFLGMDPHGLADRTTHEEWEHD